MNHLFRSGFLSLFLVGMVVTLVSAQTVSTDFSGTWVLDASKTKDLPKTLERYTLVVRQNATAVEVETDIKGEIRPQGGPGRPQMRSGIPGVGGSTDPGGPGLPGRQDGGGFPAGGGQATPGGGGFPGGAGPGGGGGFPGGGSADAAPVTIPREFVVAMALGASLKKAAYQLDGKETVLPLNTEGRPATTVTLKGQVKKDGKVLELLTRRTMTGPRGERTTTMKDTWELSKDGKFLTIKRAIETPMGGDEAKLVFARQ